MWFSVGALMRDTAFLPPAIAFDTSFQSAAQSASNGVFATMRGKFYRDVGFDVTATRYAEAGIYRPQYETRSRLYLESDMRNKFPSGNLNLLLAVTHDYRSPALFPTADGLLESSNNRIWSAELEVGFSRPRFPSSTGIFSEPNTSRSRALRCRASPRSTGFAGHSSIDKVVVAP